MGMNPKATNEPKGSLSRSGLAARLRILEGQYKSQADALRAYGINKNTYKNWITEKSLPSLEAVAQIAKVAGVTLDWLAFGEGGTAAEQGPSFDRAALMVDHERIGKITNSFNVLYEDLAGQYDEEDILPELNRVIAMYNLTIDTEDDAELDRALKIAMKMHGDSLVDKAKVRREKPPETVDDKRSA